MSCTLATLTACFSLSGLYVDVNISASDRGEGVLVDFMDDAVSLAMIDKRTGEVIHDARKVRYLDSSTQNPYVRAAVGYDIRIGDRVTIRLIELSHESSISTGRDAGFNKVSVGFTVRPFGRKGN